MTRKSLYFISILALVLSSCRYEAPETHNEGDDKVKVKVEAEAFRTDEAVRSYLAEDGQFLWQKNDTIGIYPETGAQAFFPVSSGEDASYAFFNGGGWEIKKGVKFSAYFPFIGDMYLNRKSIYVNYDGQVQASNNDTQLSGKYDYMYAPATEMENDGLTFVFKHLNCILRPKVDLPKGYYTKIIVETVDPVFVVEGDYDLTTAAPAVRGRKMSRKMTLSLNNIKLDEGEQLVCNLFCAPADLTGKELTITVVGDHRNGYRYSCKPTKAFESGVIYSMKSSDIKEVEVKDEPEDFPDDDTIINFTDPLFKSILISKAGADTDGDGEISFAEAAKVTGIGQYFKGTAIVHADELRFFIGIKEFTKEAFKNCSSLESIILPSSCTKLGSYMFDGCSKLNCSLKIPDGVTAIPEDTFRNCYTAEEILLPRGLESIGNSAFNSCSKLRKCYIPDNVKVIGTSAFYYTPMLDCTLPASLKRLGDSSFGESGISEIRIPDNMELIGSFVFVGCKNIQSIDLGNMTSIPPSMFASSNITDIVLEEGITIINKDAFSECKSLETVSFPKSLKKIHEEAFSNCTSLKEINLPDKLDFIGNYAFRNTSAATNTIAFPSSLISIGDYSFANCGAVRGTFTVPDVTIGVGAFENCGKIEKVIIPAGRKLKTSVFKNCTEIKEVIFEDGGTISVLGDTFQNCTSLETVTLPSGLQIIADYAFDGCTALKNCHIPDGVYRIGTRAFQNCPNYDPNMPSGIRSIGDSAFQGSGITRYIIPSSVTNNVESKLSNCKELEYADLSHICYKPSFLGCSKLKTVILPDNIEEIGLSMFQDCISLKEMDLPRGIKTIETRAFSGCTALEKVTFHEYVTSIADYTFENCPSLKEIELPLRLSTIGANLFSGCTSLEKIIIHDQVRYIGYRAFENCRDLKEVVMPDYITSMGYLTFLECLSLETIHLSDALAGTMETTFKGCASLREITVPSGVTSLKSTFEGCSALEKVTMEAVAPPTFSGAFSGNTKLSVIEVPAESVDAYKAADGWKTYKDIIRAAARYGSADFSQQRGETPLLVVRG